MNISRIAKYLIIGGFAYLAWQWAGVFFIVCLFIWRKGWKNKEGIMLKITNTIGESIDKLCPEIKKTLEEEK